MLAEDARAAIRMVKEAKLIAYDTETSGLDWKVNNPVGYVLTVPEKSVYIPIRHQGGGNLADPNCKPLIEATDAIVLHDFEIELAKAFKERDRLGLTTVGHNIKFDAHFSANAGILLNRQMEDTANHQALIFEHSYSFSLDNCAKYHKVTAKLGQPMYDELARQFGGAAEKKQMGNFWRLAGDNPVAMDYAAGDGITTLELRNKQIDALANEELDYIASIESDLIWVLFRMERRGIRVSPQRLDEVDNEIKQQLFDAKQALPSTYNPQSNPQTRKLMEQHGHTDWPLTESGNPSFPEAWLKTNDVGKLIVKVRKFEKLSSSYTIPMRERHMFNERVHTNLYQLATDDFGTISGRLACSDPNLQAIHKRDKELGRLFRSIYIADDGYDFYEGDYSQCEPRLFAHYSDDDNLIKGYNQVPFVDAHQVVADLLEVERDPTAKRMNMGIFTGMYPKAFAGHMGWPLDKATEAWDKWFKAFPGVKQFQDEAKAVFKARGYVTTLLGRRCRLTNPQFAYKGTSRIIQGGNADILKYKLIEANNFCEASGEENIHLLMTVHDSFEWQAIEGDKGVALSKELVEILKDVQSKPFNLIVPFEVDWKRGKNWAVATYGEPK